MSSDRSIDPAAFHDADAEFASETVARGDIPLHAASVEINGSVVAFAGESGSGKSTVAAAAVLIGHAYVSDEITAVSSADRQVTPYHRAIGLRAGGSDALGLEFPDGRRSIPGAVHPWPVSNTAQRSDGGRLAGIFLVRWRPGPNEVLDVEPPQALVELSQHVVVQNDTYLGATFRSLESLVRHVPVRRLHYGDPTDAVELVAREVEAWTA